MEPHERTKLHKLGTDGINNHARCLINMGKYAECLELISAGNIKHFGENYKLSKAGLGFLCLFFKKINKNLAFIIYLFLKK